MNKRCGCDERRGEMCVYVCVRVSACLVCVLCAVEWSG